jgi:hypothetical protein
VVTSQACGVWLDFVLRRGWPLLSSEGPVEQRNPAVDLPRQATTSPAVPSSGLPRTAEEPLG